MRSPRTNPTHLLELLVRSSPYFKGASYSIQSGPIVEELPTGVLISLESKLVSEWVTSVPHPEMSKCQAIKSLDAVAKFRGKWSHSMWESPMTHKYYMFILIEFQVQPVKH